VPSARARELREKHTGEGDAAPRRLFFMGVQNSLLVAGNRKISTAIRYLTQSTWSHAALYIGGALGPPAGGEKPRCVLEVEVGQGCIAVPLSKYAQLRHLQYSDLPPPWGCRRRSVGKS